MSRSTSTSHPRWPHYGPVPMTRCPDCSRTAPLKRLVVTTTDEHGNLGREFVKCESKPEVGKVLRKCRHFQWLDEYIERIRGEGVTLGLTLPSAVEHSGSSTRGLLASTVGNAEEVKTAELNELKQINKQLKELVHLKKQDNLVAAIFNFFVIVLFIVYMLVSR